MHLLHLLHLLHQAELVLATWDCCTISLNVAEDDHVDLGT